MSRHRPTALTVGMTSLLQIGSSVEYDAYLFDGEDGRSAGRIEAVAAPFDFRSISARRHLTAYLQLTRRTRSVANIASREEQSLFQVQADDLAILSIHPNINCTTKRISAQKVSPPSEGF